MIGLVTEQDLSILKANPGDAQPMAKGMFEIMDPNSSKAARTHPSQFIRIAIGCPTSRRFPS
jgi:hypothetical protein